MKSLFTVFLATIVALHFLFSVTNNVFGTWYGYLSFYVVEKDGKLNLPLFSNRENELRYNNLASSLTRDMLKRLEGGKEPFKLKKAILGKYATARDVDSAYTNLILKNLAVPYLNSSPSGGLMKFVAVKVLVYDYPSLADCAADKKVRSEFIPLYVTNIALKN